MTKVLISRNKVSFFALTLIGALMFGAAPQPAAACEEEVGPSSPPSPSPVRSRRVSPCRWATCCPLMASGCSCT